MTDFESNYNSSIRQLVDEIYFDCRMNIDAYDSPSGIKLDVGGTDWAVVYWPQYGDTGDRLTLMRDWKELKKPVSYKIISTGYVIKNDKISSRMSGGVMFDPLGEAFVHDENEVLTIQAIVQAAHQLAN